LCFLRPTRVHNPNGKSSGLAVLAQFTAENPYALQLAPRSPKIAPSNGDLDPHLMHDALGPSESTTQTAKSIGSAIFAQLTEECPRADWRHLATALQLVHLSAHSSSQPKRQIDRFSRFCTAHGRKSLYFTMGAPVHKTVPSHGASDRRLTHDSLGPSEPITQTAPRSVQPLLHNLCVNFVKFG